MYSCQNQIWFVGLMSSNVATVDDRWVLVHTSPPVPTLLELFIVYNVYVFHVSVVT